MSTPYLSIIIPVYNSECYLRDCINSILSQSYKDFELLLVDDGSTDSSGEICDNYSNIDPRVRVFHKKNSGVSSTRNFGMQQAKGEYFIFVDSDDEISTNALSTLCHKINEFPNADVIIFGIKISRNSIVTQENNPQPGFWKKNDFDKVYLSLYFKFLINSPVNKVYKKKLIFKGIEFPKDMSLGEDLIFCNSYLMVCQSFLLIDEALYIYKQREQNSLTTKYYSNLFQLYYFHYQNVVDTMHYFNPIWKEDNCIQLYKMYCWYIKQAINMIYRKENSQSIISKYLATREICNHSFTKACVKHLDRNDIYSFLLKKRTSIGLFLYINGAKLKDKLQFKR